MLAACATRAEEGAAPAAGDAPSAPAAPPPCDDGTYRTIDGSCASFPALSVDRSSVAIDPVRDHHTTMVIETSSGPWLYVVGGTNGWETLHSDVQRARIGPDGKLGAFEIAGQLPDARAGHCMVKKGDRLYLFGGIVGAPQSGPSKTSVVLTLDDDGKVTGSSPGPELPLGVMHDSCEIVGDHVYVLGGRGTTGRSTKLAARTTIAADGTLSAFEAQTPLTPDRSHHASFVRGKRLYLVGGLTGDPVGNNGTNRKDVVAADIDDDGNLGDWMPAGTLPTSISVSAAQLYHDAVYILGGLEEGVSFSAKIRRATFADDGTLTDFTTVKTELPEPRGHVHDTPVYENFIFSVGGQNASGESIGTVDVGRFD